MRRAPRRRLVAPLGLLVTALVTALVPARTAAGGTVSPAGPAVQSDGAGAAVETVAVPVAPTGGGELQAASATGPTVEPFEMIGASWVGASGLDAEVRVRSEGAWRPWQQLHADGDVGGDGAAPAARVVAEPLWVSSADAYELRVPADASEVQVHLVRTSVSAAPQGTTGEFSAQSTVPGAPPTFPRSAWGARPPTAVYYTTAKMAFVHHSAGTNDYAPEEVPAILRGIQAYHMDVNGWDDIAYNFLVDRFGRIWEGRGRLDVTVRGGHTGGFNTGSIGVAALGDFTKVGPGQAVIGAVADIVGWTLGRAGADPLGTATMTAGGHPNSRFAAGQVVTLPAVAAHSDVSYTSCPGALYNALGAIRQRAAVRAAQANSPFGNVDSVRLSPGGLRVTGWVVDPNADGPSDVHVYVGSAGYPLTAAQSRPDVGAMFGFGDQHGFSAVLPASAGVVSVCAYGVNVGPGGNALIGCWTVNVVDNPIGSVDAIERVPGGVRISGWALDPDTADPIDVHAYVGGSGVATNAGGPRPDLLGWFPDHGAGHGFTATVPAAAGRQRTCTYGINVGPGVTMPVHCGEVNVLVSPFGSLDAARRTAGGLEVSGWGIDPDVAQSIGVHVYSNGVFVGSFTASASRPDVGAMFSAYGSSHGFQSTVTARPGPQNVCAYGINVSTGGNALLGCTVVA